MEAILEASFGDWWRWSIPRDASRRLEDDCVQLTVAMLTIFTEGTSCVHINTWVTCFTSHASVLVVVNAEYVKWCAKQFITELENYLIYHSRAREQWCSHNLRATLNENLCITQHTKPIITVSHTNCWTCVVNLDEFTPLQVGENKLESQLCCQMNFICHQYKNRSFFS